MREILLRKQKMYLNALSVLRYYQSVWEASLPFKTDVDNLETIVQNIDLKSRNIIGSQGTSQNKKQVLKQMIEATLIICGVGIAYASHQNSNELKTKFNFTKSSLGKGNEKEVYIRCANISKAAEEIINELLAFNLSADHLKMLNNVATAYDKLISAPRQVLKADKSTNEEIKTLYSKCDVILNERLDNMMLIYKNNNTDFFIEYTNARHIGGWSKSDPLKISNEPVY